MVKFFREYKSARSSLLITIVALFLVGAVINNNPNARSDLSVGKRHIDTRLLQARYEQALKNNPTVAPQALQQHLIKEELSKLERYTQVEKLGINPSKTSISQALKKELPENKSLKELAANMGIAPDQLVLTVSDNTAHNQLLKILSDSSFTTSNDASIHQSVMGQKRIYTDILLEDSTKLVDEPTLQAFYETYKEQFITPTSYQYDYIELTPESLAITDVTDEMINQYFEAHASDYAETEFTYSITSIPQKASIAPESTDHSLRYSDIPNAHKVALAAMKPNDNKVFSDSGEKKRITLHKTQESKHIAPNMQTKLKIDSQAFHQQNKMDQLVRDIDEYAYSHPESLSEVAQHYGLELKHGSTDQPPTSLLSALEDTDTKDRHLVSRAISSSSTSANLFQIKTIIEPKQLSFSEARDQVAKLYHQQIQKAEMINALRHGADPKEYGLKSTSKEVDIYDLAQSKLHGLVSTLKNPHPDGVIEEDDGTHWVSLNTIAFDDAETPTDAIEQLEINAVFEKL